MLYQVAGPRTYFREDVEIQVQILRFSCQPEYHSIWFTFAGAKYKIIEV